MAKSMFSYLDYRDYLADRLKTLKTERAGVHAAWLADQIGVQKPYMSKVLKKDAHLSSDQLFLAMGALGFSEAEIAYLQLLFEYQRSGLAARKKILKAQIQEMQLKAFEKPSAVQVDERVTAADERRADYYLDPLCLVVHMLLTIPAHQNSPEALADTLRISPPRLREIFARLKAAGVVEKYGANGLRATEAKFHLERSSPLTRAHQKLLKMLCLEQQQSLALENQYGFMTTFSTDPTTVSEIHAEFQKFLKRVQAINENAEAEQVMQLNFDLFRWG